MVPPTGTYSIKSSLQSCLFPSITAVIRGPGPGGNPVALHLLPSCTGRHRPVSVGTLGCCAQNPESFLSSQGGHPVYRTQAPMHPSLFSHGFPYHCISGTGPHPFQLPIFPWPGQEDSVPMFLVPMVVPPHTAVLDLTKGYPNMPPQWIPTHSWQHPRTHGAHLCPQLGFTLALQY